MIHSLIALAVITTPMTAQAHTTTALLVAPNDGQAVRLSSSESDATPAGMTFIPGGTTVVGTEFKDIERLGDGNRLTIQTVAGEAPRHEAEVAPFYLDTFEVTNRQWMTYLNATGKEVSEWVVESWGGQRTIPEGTEDHPITNVNYPEIRDFLAWCGKRLPTEEEWTLAARGTSDSRTYPWGERWNSKVCQSASTTPQQPVAVYEHEGGASPFGVRNMAGNVWEWVDSPYAPYDGFEPFPFKVGRKKEPLSPDFDRTSYVAKGGSFFAPRDALRIDYRLKMGPTDSDASVGFRAARSQQRGVDVLTHAYKRLRPSQIPELAGLDFDDVVSEEFYEYESTAGGGTIITSYRYLAFAHPIPERGSGLARMRKEAREEPVTLGLLSTSEPLESPELPPGDYLLAYKGAGESKAYKEKRREEKKNKRSKKDDDEAAAPVASTPAGASAPWPGVNVSMITEDIDFPQEKEVILFYNVNGAVVGWLPLMPDAVETKKSPANLEGKDNGTDWTIEFSLDNIPRNGKMPRFTIPLKLYGEGLGR